jgi:diguanylate cyclase (GGDEF)-like protein/PAS domain S-box-containing protein
MPHPGDTPDLEALRAQITLEVREELRREWERVQREQQEALLALTRSAQVLEASEAFRRVTETGAQTIGVARVSVWLYDAQGTLMRCEDLFERATSAHTSGAELLRTDYPAYFAALEENRTVVASDAQTDPATREFFEGYLRPNGIASLLDAPVRTGGRVIGVVCHEHIGAPRTFSAEEMGFAGSLADLVAFVVEQRELRWTEKALRESEERYALAAQGANDGLWDWNLADNAIFYSPRFLELLGLDAASGPHNPSAWLSRVHPDDLPQLTSALRAMREGETAQLMNEHRVASRQGRYIWVLARAAAVRDQSGKPCRMAGSLSDITVRKTYEAQLLRDAFHDALTGLPNRALFLDRAGRLVERAKRHKESRCAVLAIDADRFKAINESLGSTVGDRMLAALGRVLAGAVRDGDTVARLGGDEFGVLIEDVRDSEDAVNVAQRIFAALADPLREGPHEVFASVSIGIALSGPEHSRAEDLLRDADIAMYRAKTRGRDRYELFDVAMQEQAKKSLHLYTELRHALNRRELVLHYQPIIALDTGKITGLEALVRWHHPQRGMIPPGEFIPIAEETGLIHALGGFVLEQACAHAKWLAERFPRMHLDMSINVSPRQLARPELVADVQRALAQTGLGGGALHLEITETMLMESPQTAKDRLRQLRGLGVGLLIDDFGTGYSSLSALHTFPIDTLKIDQSFVGRLEDEERYSAAIVEAIVTVARRLGIRVIAEGIETQRQLQAVRDHGCHLGQGYFFARPAKLEDVAALLDRSPSW